MRAVLPDSVCGLPIVNAGIANSRTTDFLPVAEAIARQGTKPSLTVVALGINDTAVDLEASVPNFPATLRLLVNSLPKSKIMLASLTPIDFNAAEGRHLRRDIYQAIDNTIRTISAETKSGLIDMAAVFSPSEAITIDGVHLSANAYVAWNAAIVDGIKNALACR